MVNDSPFILDKLFNNRGAKKNGNIYFWRIYNSEVLYTQLNFITISFKYNRGKSENVYGKRITGHYFNIMERGLTRDWGMLSGIYFINQRSKSGVAGAVS